MAVRPSKCFTMPAVDNFCLHDLIENFTSEYQNVYDEKGDEIKKISLSIDKEGVSKTYLKLPLSINFDVHRGFNPSCIIFFPSISMNISVIYLVELSLSVFEYIFIQLLSVGCLKY